MKNSFMKTKLLKSTMVILFFSIISLSAQAVESTIFTVNGMVCAFCAQGIEKKLKNMPETAAVFVDLVAKTVVVEAKPDMKIPVDKVILEIKDAGYDVIGTKAVSESVEMLRKQVESKTGIHQEMHHE
jgi:copper chaperone CopZ